MWCSSLYFFFFKQKTAYEMRISDWSSDVCSSDLISPSTFSANHTQIWLRKIGGRLRRQQRRYGGRRPVHSGAELARSEEHTSELQSLMRISYAVFCLKKKKNDSIHKVVTTTHRTVVKPRRHNYDNSDTISKYDLN